MLDPLWTSSLHRLGAAGDAMNALLVAAGHNLRLILNWLRLFVAWLMAALMGSSRNRNLPMSPGIQLPPDKTTLFRTDSIMFNEIRSGGLD